MIGLLQRVRTAAVTVNDESIASIDAGLLVFLGVERGDEKAQADRLLERISGYRVFPDASGRMNLSLQDTGYDLLVVPQFTLAADTRKGTRPSFTPAAEPTTGEALFDYFCARAADSLGCNARGKFGADMQVSLINDGPVSFWLQVAPNTSS